MVRSMHSRSSKRTIQNVLIYLLLGILGLSFIFPYWWMLISSVRSHTEIFASTKHLTWATIFPESVKFDNYVKVFVEKDLAHSMLVSFGVATVVTAGVILIASLGGYSFARLRFPGKNIAFLIALGTFMLPVESTVIPLFIEMKLFGWINTPQALIVPGIAGVMGFAIFLFRQFMADLPGELDDAARIDGCSYLGVYWRVILPQLRPAVVTLGILTFSGAWNAFFWPLVVTRGPELRVAQLSLALMASDIFGAGASMFGWGGVLAAATVLVLPLAIGFLILQRHYVRGIAMTGFK